MPLQQNVALPRSSTRRQFTGQMALAAASLALDRHRIYGDGNQASVALAKGMDRKTALLTVIQSLGTMDCQGKDVYLKGNYNSADPYPASTHPEALSEVARILREKNCARLILVERSGMGQTREIWQKLGMPALAKKLDLTLLALEDIPAADWRQEPLPGSHWFRGVEVPHFLREEGVLLVQICNLKTHRFGGQFSASLKNSIGLVAKRNQCGKESYNYMSELHNSAEQRLMIAEVNQLYRPMLVVMDAMEVFIDGGPESGETASAEVVAASHDRVALDAAGVAVLRIYGARGALNRVAVFEQEQIRRAAELKLGVESPEEICFVTPDRASGALAQQIKGLLTQKPNDEKKA